MRIDVKVKRIGNAEIPEYKTPGSAGFDLVASEDVDINPFCTESIPTGICVSIPAGFEMQIRPRSGMSLTTKIRIANSPGTIDSDYRGEIKVLAENTGNIAYKVRKGDRIAQGVLCPYFIASWSEVNDLPETVRGSSGFGSTG